MIRIMMIIIKITAVISLLLSCSINQFALKTIADGLTSQTGSSIFTGDNDPELVKDAIPFALKTYEFLLMQNPSHKGLQIATGSAYIMYANAFLQTPGEMLEDREYKEQEILFNRAKNLYLRGRGVLIDGLDLKYPGFKASLINDGYKLYLSKFKAEDVPWLFWISAAWVGAFSVDNFDFELAVGIPKAITLMEQALKLEEGFDSGVIHDFFIVYYGSLPDGMSGSVMKANAHFKRAVELCNNSRLSPYISYATSVCIKTQNAGEFKQVLGAALQMDINNFPSNRLANTIHRKKAEWLLNHSEDFFLLEEEDNEN
jgi:predicted anti-sigma-YlaC factor YlaD